MSYSCYRYIAAALLAAGSAMAQLPDGPGREPTVRLCSTCHEMARAVSLRQDRDGWNHTMNKMIAFGMKGSDQELTAVTDYLVKNYPAEDVPKVNVNKASAIELEAGLTLRRSQAAALIAYRQKTGGFKSMDDLKKVPSLDAEYIESKKERIEF